MFKSISWAKLALSILVANSAGFIGSFFTVDAVRTWYVTLEKPFFNPPSWVFGPVWTLLYTMMGTALYLVWVRTAPSRRRTWWLRLFFIHLALNAYWSILFFGQKQLFGALIEIGALWAFIVVLIGLAASFDRRVSLLLVPYLVWVSFASALNYELWRLNS